jgi:hypothetical protein
VGGFERLLDMFVQEENLKLYFSRSPVVTSLWICDLSRAVNTHISCLSWMMTIENDRCLVRSDSRN